VQHRLWSNKTFPAAAAPRFFVLLLRSLRY